MAYDHPDALHQAYEGLRVLDLSQGIAGPYCALILGQMGADVIKVEPPQGDWGRTMGLPKQGFSAIALAFNRGKRSVALDARLAAGRDAILQLGERADVVVQSFRPGVADRLGFGYHALRVRNPRVIYVSISGFGQSGPYADRPGTDSVVQALTGMMTSNRGTDGMPQRVKPFIGDLSCGIYAANAVGAALYARARRGAGTQIDVNLLGTMAALQNSSLIDHALRAGAPETAVTYPQGVFRTSDGHILVFAMNNAMFGALCDAIGRSDWRQDPRMQTPQARIAVGEEINAGVAEALQQRSTTYWTDCFRQHDVLYGEVKDYAQFIDDEQVRHLGLIQSFQQPGLGAVPFADLPGIPPGVRGAGQAVPVIGEHTVAVLRTLGYTDADLAQLASDKVIPPLQTVTGDTIERI